MYVILGASGHTGSIIADFLLSKGEKVRVLGRDPGRLERLVRNGAEALVANVRICAGCLCGCVSRADFQRIESAQVAAVARNRLSMRRS